MNSANEQMQYYMELMDFCNSNNIKSDSEFVLQFDAWVEYSSKKDSPTGKAKIIVYKKGVNMEGNIEIIDDKFNSEVIHTGFSVAYQVYVFDKNCNKLFIKGSSPKMSGDYIVSITPVR